MKKIAVILVFYKLLQLKIHAFIFSSGPIPLKQNSSQVAKYLAVFLLGFFFSPMIFDPVFHKYVACLPAYNF